MNIRLLSKTMYFFVFSIVFLLGSAHHSQANPVVAEVVGAGQSAVNIVMAQPNGQGQEASQLSGYIQENMRIVPFATMIDTASIPGSASAGAKGENIDFKKFSMAGAQLLITTDWLSAGDVELRVFEVAQGKFLFGNRYVASSSESALRDVADKFCADFLEATIGKGDLFRSTIAFVRSGGSRQSDVWAVKPNGRNLRRLSELKGESLSPTWSADGRYVLFTHIDLRSHALGIWDASTGTARRVRFPGNTVIGPCYLPDNQIAVGLTDGRYPSIFLLNQSFQKVSKLEGSYAIDVSPSIDASGRKMAFTSGRLGGPQIFVKDLGTGSVQRVSQSGSYNTDPSISPDGTLVAFSRMVGSGQHRIFVHDLVTGQERQVSHGPGSDEEPAFAPDSFFIAFSSTRYGSPQIFLTTRAGGNAVQLPTGSGDASFPSWGIAR